MADRKTIRVCLAAPSLDINGGQSHQAARLLKGFSTEAALAVGFIPHNPRLPRALRFLGRIKYVRTIATTTHYTILLATRLWRYDIVQVFSASYWSYLLSTVPALFFAKLYRKKIILNYRSGEAEDHLANWPRTTVPLMRKYDAIVVPSGYLVDVFGRFDLRATVIANTVEPDKFIYRERSPVRPRFLSSRILEPLYNVGNVIRAFRIIQQHIPDASLTIAGNGVQRAELERLVGELGVQNTRFIGFVPFGDMPGLYDAHDVLLMGNDLDNMPASLIESCACGILIVSTNVGGIPYIVEHEKNALLVGRGDYEGLAREAMRLLDDPLLARTLSHNARERANDFTWGRARDKWLALYERLLESARPCVE